MKQKILRIIYTWLCVYPIVTILLLTLRALDFKLPLWQQTLIVTLFLVPIMVLIIAPRVSASLQRIAQD